MAVTFTPMENSVLIDTNMLNFVTEVISVTGFLEIEEWSWDITPIGDAKDPVIDINFSFTPSGETLSVSYFSDEELFPLQYIRYIDPQNKPHDVYRWEDLPEPYLSPEITAALPNPTNQQQWNLEVSVTGIVEGDGGDMQVPIYTEETVTANYTIIIFADYSALGPILVAEIEKRRFL